MICECEIFNSNFMTKMKIRFSTKRIHQDAKTNKLSEHHPSSDQSRHSDPHLSAQKLDDSWKLSSSRIYESQPHTPSFKSRRLTAHFDVTDVNDPVVVDLDDLSDAAAESGDSSTYSSHKSLQGKMIFLLHLWMSFFL